MNVVYTCITGTYDELIPPVIVTENWRYVCFTNNKQLLDKKYIGVYEILPIINEFNLDPVRLARQYKILGLNVNDSGILIWHDANFRITCNLNELVEKYLDIDTELVLSIHPKRNCLYKEAQKCIELKKDNKDIINTQINEYSINKMPYYNGLYETGVLVRRKFTKETSIFYYKWWSEVKKHSRRDQISLPYCLFKYPDFIPKIKAIPAKELRGNNFIKTKHLENEFGGKF